jgi:hypothetical protein
MDQHLIVVAGDKADLWDYLKWRFSWDEEVQVILDQRQGERRQCRQADTPERRRADRRRPPESYRRSDWFVCVKREAN